MSLLKDGDSLSPLMLGLDKGKNSAIFRKFKGFVNQFRLLKNAGSVLVALSGGPDSVCLLHMLYLLSLKHKFRLYGAHFHHGLRGEEADRDACFSRMICSANSITFFLGSGDVKALSNRQGLGIQDAARKLRYRFLMDIAEKKSIDVVATGHTADDQAEELILRFIRGSSLGGLSGIRPGTNGKIIRPLLFARKKEIVEHLEKIEIPFVNDSSNLEEKYTRNRVRMILVPMIKKGFNPSITGCLSRTAMLLQDDEDTLSALAADVYKKAKKPRKRFQRNCERQPVLLQVRRLRGQPPSLIRRALLYALQEAGVSRERVVSDHLVKLEHMTTKAVPSSLYRLPGGFSALRIYDWLIISEDFSARLQKLRESSLSLNIESTGRIDLGHDLGIIILEKREAFRFGNRQMQERPYPRPIFLGCDTDIFPIEIRFRKAGDRFLPLGAKEPVKLKNFFINRQIPRIVRDIIPVIVKKGEIACLCGIEVGEHFRVKGQEIMEVRWEPPEFLMTIFSLSKTRHALPQ